MSGRRRVSLLGSTGSIGTQALDVIARTPDRFEVHALAANTDVDTICAQAEAHRPSRIVMADEGAAAVVRERLPGVDVAAGTGALVELAADTDADVVLNAVVGSAGLEATLATLDAKILLALANKESCVAGGPLVADRLAAGARCVPVDSEHASTHMCLLGEGPGSVARLILTASGGPFRGRSAAELADVTADDALRHPTWDMGAKITIDSATLMNKGLEVLEANVLFGLGLDAIDVVCHPSSVIHCLVGLVDGSWKAALGPPDMRVPIAYAIGYPDRPAWGAEPVDWSAMDALTFEAVDTETFACLPLAYEAGRIGGTAPAVLNAANEVAVEAFLAGRIGFLQIAEVVARALDAGADADVGFGDAPDLEAVRAADAWARHRAGAGIP